MDELADVAGVSKATIYRWWPSKETLALDVLLTEWRTERPRSEPELPGQTEGDACRRRHAFTARETMEDRIQVSDKNGKRGSRGSERCVAPADTQVIRDHHRGKPLDAVAE